MSRYIRMVMLLLAGLCFMIPMLGKTSSARPVTPHGHLGHGPTGTHQTFVADAPDEGSDPSAPCAP